MAVVTEPRIKSVTLHSDHLQEHDRCNVQSAIVAYWWVLLNVHVQSSQNCQLLVSLKSGSICIRQESQRNVRWLQNFVINVIDVTLGTQGLSTVPSSSEKNKQTTNHKNASKTATNSGRFTEVIIKDSPPPTLNGDRDKFKHWADELIRFVSNEKRRTKNDQVRAIQHRNHYANSGFETRHHLNFQYFKGSTEARKYAQPK
eukprot:725161-Amphidinium_carterae.2